MRGREGKGEREREGVVGGREGVRKIRFYHRHRNMKLQYFHCIVCIETTPIWIVSVHRCLQLLVSNCLIFSIPTS